MASPVVPVIVGTNPLEALLKKRMRLVLGMAAIGVAGGELRQLRTGKHGQTFGVRPGRSSTALEQVSGGELQALQSTLKVFEMHNPNVDVSSTRPGQARPLPKPSFRCS